MNSYMILDEAGAAFLVLLSNPFTIVALLIGAFLWGKLIYEKISWDIYFRNERKKEKAIQTAKETGIKPNVIYCPYCGNKKSNQVIRDKTLICHKCGMTCVIS